MTREEAIEKSYDCANKTTCCSELVKKIYADFESRTCEGCKFYDNENPQVTKKGYCSKFLRHEHSTFMCNNWEQK